MVAPLGGGYGQGLGSVSGGLGEEGLEVVLRYLMRAGPKRVY